MKPSLGCYLLNEPLKRDLKHLLSALIRKLHFQVCNRGNSFFRSEVWRDRLNARFAERNFTKSERQRVKAFTINRYN